MSKQRRPAKLFLTERARKDIATIRKYSIENWGKKTAERYIDDFQSAFDRIKTHPNLLQSVSNLHESLRFYRVNQHVLVCSVRPQATIVVSVFHGRMDVASKLSELSPTLEDEVDLLISKLHQKTRRRKH
ncbi:MAG: hypothetical protein CMJ78_19020 [Planctomycetaceae bacterium]|nr:hypothetical protein [Planctomycetaceae bacterium]